MCQGLGQLSLPDLVLDVGHEALVDCHHQLPDVGLGPNVGHRLVQLGQVFGQGLEVGAGDLVGLQAAKSVWLKLNTVGQSCIQYCLIAKKKN